MAQDPKNYRDPKVTTDTRGTRRSSTSWVWMALAVIVILLILAWLFGWMGTNRVATVPADDAVVVEESADEVVDETEQGLEATGNAIEGAAEETGDAVGNAAEATGEAVEGAVEQTGEALDATGQAIEGAAEDAGQAVEGAADEATDTIDITPEAEAPEVGDDVQTETVPIQPSE